VVQSSVAHRALVTVVLRTAPVMERYTHGHFGSVLADHSSRTAANSAAFLLPHLDPGDVVLDIGCGPGSITLDLAAAVERVTGVDAAPEAVERARAAAQGRGVSNVEFRIGDVYGLDFEESSFDVVFAHQVLQHLADPVAALREAQRILRPGGIVAVRDSDYGTMVHDPHEARIDRWLELYRRLARRNGGEPDAGRKLYGWVWEAGFEDVTASATTWTYASEAAVEGWRKLWTSRLLEARMGRDAVEMGLATRAEIEDLAAGFDAWAARPHPFFAFLHGEVLARKPRA
jgi:ubiquinone/menaquinone biosynthesis C-methylase UbiE